MINLNVNTGDKKFIFNLGRIFARGEQVHILNKDDVDKKIREELNLGYAKSFNMMIKFWQDNNFSPNIFTGEKNESNIFLICPVRRATKNEKNILTETIAKYEQMGMHVHYPERDTNQNPVVDGTNTGGYNICLQNATAIAASSAVALYYNPQSVGSMFDLGVTYELAQQDPSRMFFLENEIELDENNYIEKMILTLLKGQNIVAKDVDGLSSQPQ